MSPFEMERIFYIGVAGAAIFCLFGTIIGVLARLKGYSFLAWFGTGGTLLVSALLLAFRPKLRGVELSDEERALNTHRGNRVGWILSVVNALLIVVAADWPMIANFGEAHMETFRQRYFFTALQWIEWIYCFGIAIMFVRFLLMPRGSRHPLVIIVFAAIAFQFVWRYVVDAIEHSDAEDNMRKILLIARTFNSFLGILVMLILCYLVTEPLRAIAVGQSRRD